MDESIQALKAELDRQRRLTEASHVLHSTLDIERLLEYLLTAATEGVDADRGTVYIVDAEAGELWSRVLTAGEHLEIRLPIGKGIAGSVAASGETVRIEDAYADPRFDKSWDESSGYRTREVLCAPIRNRESSVVGVFQLLNCKRGSFSESDEDYLAALSVSAALAIENAWLHEAALEKERYDREVSLARLAQRHLQPERGTLDVEALATAGLNEICEDATGDYYDLIPEWQGGRLGLVVGDVSGHGLQAALIMAEARALLRAAARSATGATEAVEELEDLLVHDLPDGKFLSLFVAVIEPSTGEVQWCNAGHNPPFLLRAGSDEVQPLKRTGLALGLAPGMGWRQGEPFTMEPGDVLFLYTDGITEARGKDDELFGEERLYDAVRANRDANPEELLDAVRRAVHEWMGEQPVDDDLTLVAARRLDS